MLIFTPPMMKIVAEVKALKPHYILVLVGSDMPGMLSEKKMYFIKRSLVSVKVYKVDWIVTMLK